MESDRHSSKKLRSESGSGIGTGSSDIGDGVHKVAPSAVVHVRGLAENVTENDLTEAVANFGVVSFVIRIPNKNMALIEFEDIESATDLVTHAQSEAVLVGDKPAQFNYSTSTRIKRPDSNPPAPPNRVIILTITNPRHPITVEVINAISCPFGTVLRIVIFRKTGVQAMVEFEDVESASKAKQGLHGQDIYSGCCTIKADFAKPETLNVRKNDADTWDFTVNSFSRDAHHSSSKSQPLLADPKYGAGPLPFGIGGPGSDSLHRRGVPFGQLNASGQMPLLHHQHQSYCGGYSGMPIPYGGGGCGDIMNDTHNHHSPLTPMALLNAYESFANASSLGSNNNCVLMVYGLESTKFNCQRLFNLLCVYGNVLKIKFLKTKEGSAMVQMGDRDACDRVLQYLNGASCFGSKLAISLSKQPYLQDVVSPHKLPDGTCAYMDFIGSRNQRYTSPDAAAKSRPFAPTPTLYFFNAPPNVDEDTLRQVFTDAGVNPPDKILKFPPKSERSSRGLLQWFRVESSIDALICANHAELPHPAGGKTPFVLKLAFSHSSVD